MKVIKYLVAGALMLSIAAPTMAQDVKSQVDAITKVVVDAKGDAVAAKAQIKDFMKLNIRMQRLLQVSVVHSLLPKIMNRPRLMLIWQ